MTCSKATARKSDQQKDHCPVLLWWAIIRFAPNMWLQDVACRLLRCCEFELKRVANFGLCVLVRAEGYWPTRRRMKCCRIFVGCSWVKRNDLAGFFLFGYPSEWVINFRYECDFVCLFGFRFTVVFDCATFIRGLFKWCMIYGSGQWCCDEVDNFREYCLWFLMLVF